MSKGKNTHYNINPSLLSVLYIPQPTNIDIICKAVVETADKLAPSLTTTAEMISRIFTQLFTLFSGCHNSYNGGGKLSDTDINSLG